MPLNAQRTEEAFEGEEEPRNTVRVRHAEIRGRVFIASEREDEEEYPAEDVVVQVREEETEEIILETRTDAEGFYEFPKIDVGEYLLRVGRLQLPMTVIPEQTETLELPKIIIVMIPKELAR